MEFSFSFVPIPIDLACWSKYERSIWNIDIVQHNPVALAIAVTNRKGVVQTGVESEYVNIILDSCLFPAKVPSR